MTRKKATLDEIIATFSDHISKNYPLTPDFRRNFDVLLWGKRDRTDAAGYAGSLERNIAYLSGLIDEAMRLVGRLISPDERPDEKMLGHALEDIEGKVRRQTDSLHARAFVEGLEPAFRELRDARLAGGAAYVDKLEFNYRYLMTMRIFLFEFVSVLAAVRSEYEIIRAGPDAAGKIRNQVEIMAHCYLGNVSVGDGGAPGKGGAGQGHAGGEPRAGGNGGGRGTPGGNGGCGASMGKKNPGRRRG